MNATSLFENQRINVLFIIIVSVLIYLNSLFAGVSSLDDSGLFQNLQQGGIRISQLLSAAGGNYFRPLAGLSYLIDNAIWHTNPAAFHLTNLLLHTANALLVYGLALTFLSGCDMPRPIALIAATLFAVHPANSESVAWISGRTDLLCCLFFLPALMVLTRTTLAPLPSFALLFMSFICSLAAKESSIALLAITPVWLYSREGQKWDRRSAALCAALATATILYFVLRSGIGGHLDKGISTVTGTLTKHDPLMTIYDTLAVLGFYFRKMVWPFPLNIAIYTIDKPLYLFVGCGALAASILMFFKLENTRLPLAIMVFGLVPPLLAYHASIPWMPIAERYLYIPLTGAVLLVAVLIRDVGAYGRMACFPVILALAVATTHRAVVWADPVAFWADTVANSPAAPAPRVIYACELQETGRYSEAARQLDIVNDLKYEDYLYWRCRARQSLANKDLNGYESAMLKAIGKSGTPSEIYSEIAGTLSRESIRHAEQRMLLSKAIVYYEKSWDLDPRTIAGLYSAARLSLRLGDTQQCRRLLNLYLANAEKVPKAELQDKARALLHDLT